MAEILLLILGEQKKDLFLDVTRDANTFFSFEIYVQQVNQLPHGQKVLSASQLNVRCGSILPGGGIGYRRP